MDCNNKYGISKNTLTSLMRHRKLEETRHDRSFPCSSRSRLPNFQIIQRFNYQHRHSKNFPLHLGNDCQEPIIRKASRVRIFNFLDVKA